MLMGAPMYEGNLSGSRSILLCSSRKSASASASTGIGSTSIGSTSIGSTSIGSSRDNNENVEPITLYKCQDSSSDQKLKIFPQRYDGAESGVYSRYQVNLDTNKSKVQLSTNNVNPANFHLPAANPIKILNLPTGHPRVKSEK